MDRVPTRWCPLPSTSGGADKTLRLREGDSAFCKAATSIDTNLCRWIGPVLRDEYWREGMYLKSECCEVNTSHPDDGGGYSYHHRDGVATMQRLEIAHAQANSLPCQICEVVWRSFQPVWMSVEGIGSSPVGEQGVR